MAARFCSLGSCTCFSFFWFVEADGLQPSKGHFFTRLSPIPRVRADEPGPCRSNARSWSHLLCFLGSKVPGRRQREPPSSDNPGGTRGRQSSRQHQRQGFGRLQLQAVRKQRRGEGACESGSLWSAQPVRREGTKTCVTRRIGSTWGSADDSATVKCRCNPHVPCLRWPSSGVLRVWLFKCPQTTA